MLVHESVRASAVSERLISLCRPKRSKASRRRVRALFFSSDCETEAFHTSSLVLKAEVEKPRREVMRRSVEKVMPQGRVKLASAP